LHFEDVSKLLGVLHSLVDKGNTVLVIEHNLDVIKTADWLIDMGPEGGSGGGTVVAEGTPEEVAMVQASHTGAFLGELLSDRPARRTGGTEVKPAKPTKAAKVAVKGVKATTTGQATKAPAKTTRGAAQSPAKKAAAAKAPARKTAVKAVAEPARRGAAKQANRTAAR